jgi:hypothetical protein
MLGCARLTRGKHDAIVSQVEKHLFPKTARKKFFAIQ